ncbi:hypothetical protein RHMOL_Rhmol08G0308000 [Rhododendron molle]|uniref:Uncharacterized protein n=1 Tax=Rhododendron molle TaxID=49168 RepID=A0ACC0MVM5_RHOML|nr:hypothetical protein RHMOL_Rhmol08G0308000 [Rhododendron molle]
MPVQDLTPPPDATARNGAVESSEAEDEAWVWAQIKAEARRDAESEPALASYLYSTIISHSSLSRSLSFHLGNKLCSSTLLSTLLYDLFLNTFSSSDLLSSTVADLRATRERDPACTSFSHCLLNYKGFLSIQAHRVAHNLWIQNRKPLALALQSRIADVFAVDIHPGAKIGKGVLLDHATGVVIGETAVVGGDRHPKIRDGVLLGAGATVLGNVRVGEGAKVGAGSLVLIDVPPWTTAVGNPAKEACLFAKALNLNSVSIENDNAQLIFFELFGIGPSLELMTIISDICMLAAELKLSFCWTGNEAAHWIASSQAVSLGFKWVLFPPPVLSSLLCSDVLFSL